MCFSTMAYCMSLDLPSVISMYAWVISTPVHLRIVELRVAGNESEVPFGRVVQIVWRKVVVMISPPSIADVIILIMALLFFFVFSYSTCAINV